MVAQVKFYNHTPSKIISSDEVIKGDRRSGSATNTKQPRLFGYLCNRKENIWRECAPKTQKMQIKNEKS